MDLLRPLPKTKINNDYIVVMTDCYSKSTKMTPTRATTATNVAQGFNNDWAIPYGIPEQLLTDNGPQFVKRNFQRRMRRIETEVNVGHHLPYTKKCTGRAI